MDRFEGGGGGGHEGGERDENVHRKEFLPTELVAICRAIEPAEREKAKERKGRPGKARSAKLAGHEKGDVRAKDATRLCEAVDDSHLGGIIKKTGKDKGPGSHLISAFLEVKLTEQRRFVVWWDGEEKHPGRRPSKNAVAVADQQRLKAGEEALPDRDTLHRWRIRFKDPRKFDAALQAAQERCVKVCEARQGQSGGGVAQTSARHVASG